MKKLKKINELNDENVKFFQVVGLVVAIKERKMTLKSLRAEIPENIISLLKTLEWIVAKDENSEIEITALAQGYVTEYHAMIVLENIKNRMKIGKKEEGIRKADLERNAPAGVVDLLINGSLVKVLEYPAGEIVHATDKGEKELKEYFKNEA